MATTGNDVTVKLIEEIIDAFNRQDADAIAHYFADDGTFFLARGKEPWGKKLIGPEAIRTYIANRFTQIPDMRWVDSRSWTNGNLAVSDWTVLGTTSSGEKLNWRGCDLWEFENGKIKTKDTYWKYVQSS